MTTPVYRSMVGSCQWVFKSGWWAGETCTADAWYDVGPEARCYAHRNSSKAIAQERGGSLTPADRKGRGRGWRLGSGSKSI